MRNWARVGLGVMGPEGLVSRSSQVSVGDDMTSACFAVEAPSLQEFLDVGLSGSDELGCSEVL